MCFCLARGLDHIRDDALAVEIERGSIDVPVRERAYQGLIKQIFVVARRSRCIVDRMLAAPVDTAPTPRQKPPLRRHFRNDVDARANVAGSLVVVRRSGEHGVRPMRKPIAVGAMESVDGRSETVRIAADLVERHEAVECVERGVLDPLRGYRRGELLKAHGKRPIFFGERRGRAFRRPQHEDVADEIEHAGVGVEALLARYRDRPVDIAPVLRGDAMVDVRPIHRKAGGNIGKRVPERR